MAKNIWFILIFKFLASGLISQSNIIPNGNFESTTGDNCSLGGDSEVLDGIVSNWKAAKHNNDKKLERPMLIDLNNSNCSPFIDASSFCGNYSPSQINPVISKKFVRLQANYIKKCQENKKHHDAVGVALENGATFTSGTNYIIRYKINPLRAILSGALILIIAVPAKETCFFHIQDFF